MGIKKTIEIKYHEYATYIIYFFCVVMYIKIDIFFYLFFSSIKRKKR